MDFNSFDQERKFREMWDSVRIERSTPYSLFTFGDSELPYFLVSQASNEDSMVKLCKGEVRITRPKIITPFSAQPEFENFFDNEDDEDFVKFLMTRTAAFSNLKMHNHTGKEQFVSDSVEEVVERLNRQLDNEEEDRVAILSAPPELTSFAVLRYTTERIMESANDNIQELRERGMLNY